MTELTRHIPLDMANLGGAWWGLLAAAGLTGALITGAVVDVLTRRWPPAVPTQDVEQEDLG